MDEPRTGNVVSINGGKDEKAEKRNPGFNRVPQKWADLAGEEERAAEALRPLHLFGDILARCGEDADENTLHPGEVGKIIIALVERAEMIHDIPDGTLI